MRNPTTDARQTPSLVSALTDAAAWILAQPLGAQDQWR